MACEDLLAAAASARCRSQDHKAAKAAGGPTRVENAKIALIQVG